MEELYYGASQGNRVWYQLNWLWFMLSGRLVIKGAEHLGAATN